VLVGLAALAALDLANLLYVAAAVVVATLISALIALRHRRPKSVESGIESFSRELRALAPEPDGAEGRTTQPPPPMTGVAVRPRRMAATRGAGRRPPGEHYRNPVPSSLDDGEKRPAAGQRRVPGPEESRGTVDGSTRADGQAG
jgi:hypothetical protein